MAEKEAKIVQENAGRMLGLRVVPSNFFRVLRYKGKVAKIEEQVQQP